MSDPGVTIIIDGVKVQTKPDKTIMEAGDEAGIYIPRLCYHPDLPPGGHCRVCTIKVNGKFANACTAPANEGVIIENDTEELNTCRRRIIEMLFAEGNHYCPACEASGKCELQAMGYRLGLLAPPWPHLERERDLDASHPDVYIDRERCILCGRCVRASRVLDQKVVFGFKNRGHRMRLDVDAIDGLGQTSMSAADKAARICPTGCLVVKREGYRIPIGRRPYDHEQIGADIERKRTANP